MIVTTTLCWLTGGDAEVKVGISSNVLYLWFWNVHGFGLFVPGKQLFRCIVGFGISVVSTTYIIPRGYFVQMLDNGGSTVGRHRYTGGAGRHAVGSVGIYVIFEQL